MLRDVLITLFAYCFKYPFHHIILGNKPLKNICESLSKDLLTSVWFTMFAFVSGTVVIHVPALLQVTRERTATYSALDQTGKGKRMPLPVAFTVFPTCERKLNFMP
ncbi:MAG: hypothetical protein KAW14_03255 [Candidatus Aegiribacteria sp.]|nr:hypothetical protein [Candidatus Aegiribacteria sp.]